MEGTYRIDQRSTPWDMPHEIFWAIQEGAAVDRAQWVLDNRPDVGFDELKAKFALHDDVISQLSRVSLLDRRGGGHCEGSSENDGLEVLKVEEE